MMGLTKALLLAAGVGAFTVPIFSSGLRRNLSFARWLYNHTIFGDFPLYVPRELALSDVPVVAVDFIETTYWTTRSGKQYRLQDFITPDTPKVQEYATALLDWDEDNRILGYWAWVCRSFDYKFEPKDYWSFPEEVINLYERNEKPAIDCEDGAYLLTSMLLASDIQAYANIGYLYDTLHAWVTVPRWGREYILETTLTGKAMQRLLDSNPWLDVEYFPEYKSLYKFDHREVIETRA